LRSDSPSYRAFANTQASVLILGLREKKSVFSAKGIGTIAIGESNIRVDFSCLEKGQIADLFAQMYAATAEFTEKMQGGCCGGGCH
jgi:hypothetical protein